MGRFFFPREISDLQSRAHASSERITQYSSSGRGAEWEVGSRPSRRERAQKHGSYSGGEDDLVVPAALIGELSKAAGARSLGQDLFDRDDELEKHLKITDREKQAIQQAWGEIRKQRRQLEARVARSEDLEGGSVKITVPNVGVVLKDLGHTFKNSLDEILDQNRANVFAKVKQLDRLMTPVEGERIYTVRVEAVGNGSWRYHMRYQDNHDLRVWVGESVPEEIRHITDSARIQPRISPVAENEKGE